LKVEVVSKKIRSTSRSGATARRSRRVPAARRRSSVSIVEQVALGGGVPVAGGLASVVVGAGAE